MRTITILQESFANKPNKYDQNLDNFEQTICIVCGRENETYWDPRYRGMRASCENCGINWAES